GERVIGFVHVADVRRIPRSEWSSALSGELAGRTTRVLPLGPQENAYAALQRMGRHDADAIAVVEGDQIVGLLRRSDIERWLAFEAGDDSRRPGAGALAGSRG